MAQGFDVNRFMREGKPRWEALEALLKEADTRGMKALGVDGARRFGVLYRAASADLIRARTELVDATLVDYLNDLVARAYVRVYAKESKRRFRIGRFFFATFPRLFRAEWRMLCLSASLLFLGATIGAVGVAVDPSAASVLVPEMHQDHTPEERVAHDEGQTGSGHVAIAFSSFLFTHNIQVTFLLFAMGITFGIGTGSLVLYNGVPLGALAMQYHLAGQGLFFWAWILPHGIPELTETVVAGAAGLILARGLLFPGRRGRAQALLQEAKRAALLVLGGMPILVLAGLIEGTISQIHEPTIPYPLKLLFALLVGVSLYGWLLFAGRRRGPLPAGGGAGAGGPEELEAAR